MTDSLMNTAQLDTLEESQSFNAKTLHLAPRVRWSARRVCDSVYTCAVQNSVRHKWLFYLQQNNLQLSWSTWTYKYRLENMTADCLHLLCHCNCYYAREHLRLFLFCFNEAKMRKHYRIYLEQGCITTFPHSGCKQWYQADTSIKVEFRTFRMVPQDVKS